MAHCPWRKHWFSIKSEDLPIFTIPTFEKTRFFWPPAPGKIPRVGRGRWSGHAQRPPQKVHLPPKPQDNGASTAEIHGDSWSSITSKFGYLRTHKKRVTRIINPTVTLG